MKAIVEQIRSGNTRFVDLPTTVIPPTENQRENVERTSEQPDGEPGISEEQDRSRLGSEEEYTPTVPPEEEISETRNNEVPTIPESPENVPGPTDDDDDLFCETLALEEDQVWRFEVDLDKRDFDMLRLDPRPHEFAFLVSASKKR